MTSLEVRQELIRILAGTARAHHAATGGINPQWATWYAEHCVDQINELVDQEWSVSELANRLSEADRRYRSEDLDQSWPEAYAGWLLDEQGGG